MGSGPSVLTGFRVDLGAAVQRKLIALLMFREHLPGARPSDSFAEPCAAASACELGPWSCCQLGQQHEHHAVSLLQSTHAPILPAMSPPPNTPATSIASVRVPASTSNLGPGFDQLGLALELYLEVELRGPIESPEHRFGHREGDARDWPAGPNLLFEAFDARMRASGQPAARYQFDVRSEIPLQRGLGSSGAAVAAGLLLADACCIGTGVHYDRVQLAQLGLELEGHPDNVTASLFGGCTLGVPNVAGELTVVEHELHAGFVYSVVWSSSVLSTERARAAMPSALPLEDVVWNTRRLSLLLEGLRRGDPALLREGSQDRLHTPFRLPLIPGAERALAAAVQAGAWMSAISGSGSALIALQDDERCAIKIAAAMATALARQNDWVESRCLRADTRGAQLSSPSAATWTDSESAS